MFEGIVDQVLKRRGLIGLGLLVAALVGGFGGSKLQGDFSVEAFFAAGDVERDALHDFQERWGPDDNLVMVTIRASDGSSLVTPERFASLETLRAALAATDGVRTVVSPTTTPRLGRHSPGELDLRGLAEVAPARGEDLGPWLEELQRHPLVVPALLSEDFRTAAMVVQLEVDGDDITRLRPAVTALRASIEATVAGLDLEASTAGIPAVRTDFFQMIFDDQFVMVPLIAALMAGLLLLLFRRLHGLLAAGLAALLPSLAVFALMGLVGEPVGILNQSYFTLLPVIAIADAIHLISRFHEEARRVAAPGERLTPEQRDGAIRTATLRIGFACLLTTTTTGIGFLSLAVARMPILRSFGVFAAVGVALAYVSVLIVVPLVLSFARGAVPEASREGSFTRTDRLLMGSARLATTRPWLVLGLTGAFAALAAAGAPRVVVDNQLTALLADDHETTRANHLADEELGGILAVEVDVRGEPGALYEPDVLRAMLVLEDAAMERDAVRSSTSAARYVAALTGALTGTAEVPASRAAVSQLLVLAEGTEGLSTVLDVADGSSGRVVLRARDQGGLAFEALANDLRGEAQRAFEGLPVTAHLTGTAFVAYRGINAVTHDLRASLMLAFLAVMGVILLLFRSPRIAVLCLLPNGLPLLAGYGLMGWMGWRLEPTPAVVFTVALGIAVDDTIHLLVRYREQRGRGDEHLPAIRDAVLHSGRAVTITSVVLCAGFGVNVLSSFPTMQVLAVLGATVIAVAWACDLFVLPALLALWGEKKETP